MNALNYANFRNAGVNVSFRHIKYNNTRIYRVSPRPCRNEVLSVLWDGKVDSDLLLRAYEFTSLLFSGSKKLVLSKPEVLKIDETGMRFRLPDTGFEINTRIAKRHPVSDILVSVIYNGTLFEGSLLDFSARSFRAEIILRPWQANYWIENESKVQVILKKGDNTIFSGECGIVRQTVTARGRMLVLKPTQASRRLFRPKIYRSARVKLIPSPRAVFTHPATDKKVTLDILDMACPGFSVEEWQETAVLFTGLILPEVRIEFAAGFSISCMAQVVHQKSQMEGIVRSGLAILDIDIKDQAKLSSVLHSVDGRSSSCDRLELDDLWKLFFDSGFIYPEKYAGMHRDKEKFIQACERLYNHDSGIARHFIYRERGRILGHMSMLRFYENAWLIHHHAALKTNIRAGLNVMHQVGAYINDFHSFPSTHMNYVMCYFRPENKFPYRVFGGCSKAIGDPKGCSLDLFAYFKVEKGPYAAMPANSLPLKLREEDFEELRRWYEETSGGLALDALDLTCFSGMDSLKQAYAVEGFKRERIVRGIKRDGLLRAVIAADISDIGLNFSDLTNVIHVFVLDRTLPFDELMGALKTFANRIPSDYMTTLVHPAEYPRDMNISGADRFYHLWVLNMSHTDQYFDFLEHLLKGNRGGGG